MTGDPGPRAVFFGTSIMAHGIDAEGIRPYHDEAHDAWILYLDPEGNMSVRIDLKDDEATLARNQAGLAKLAEAATELEQMIGERLAERDQAREGGSS